MSESPLVLPRRLAIRILHAAQTAQPGSIRGVVTARDGQPSDLRVGSDVPVADEAVWAALWSCPQTEAVPNAGELVPGQLSLVVSLNTKGVLEMRAWQRQGETASERVLQIRD